MKIGSNYLGGGECEFRVWAPFLKNASVEIIRPEKRKLSMEEGERGYWKVRIDDVAPGSLYYYELDGEERRPDPASEFQPKGVHGPSQVVDHNSFDWEDEDWSNIPLERMIIYELHVGTFTPEGTFESIIPRLDSLNDLGVNAIEIMPVGQFPGERNWGYDGTYPYAVQNSYGGPSGLKKFVNVCHERKISVILDVVYNHLGPEGNYLRDYGPYFTDKYRTPWGDAVNFDGKYSDEVRNFFIENTLHWFGSYHIDALRIDAVHAIHDMSAKPFLRELSEAVHEYSRREDRKFYLIAESDLNDVKIVNPPKLGGFGFDAQWCDDFHHSLHALLTGEEKGYYVDYGETEHLVKALREGFVYSWDYSEYRKRRFGSSSENVPGYKFMVFSQNHDQVGNRMLGERLSELVSFEALKLAAAMVLVSPYVPLLFMGEEYGERSPFLYFVSYSDQELIEAVRGGRKKEFDEFEWRGEPPDPQSPETFHRSKLEWEMREEGKRRALLNFYRLLIKLRKEITALSGLDKEKLDASTMEGKNLLLLRRWDDEDQVFCAMNFDKTREKFRIDLPDDAWERVIDSSDAKWRGPGSSAPEQIERGQTLEINPQSFVLYERGRG